MTNSVAGVGSQCFGACWLQVVRTGFVVPVSFPRTGTELRQPGSCFSTRRLLMRRSREEQRKIDLGQGVRGNRPPASNSRLLGDPPNQTRPNGQHAKGNPTRHEKTWPDQVASTDRAGTATLLMTSSSATSAGCFRTRHRSNSIGAAHRGFADRSERVAGESDVPPKHPGWPHGHRSSIPRWSVRRVDSIEKATREKNRRGISTAFRDMGRH